MTFGRRLMVLAVLSAHFSSYTGVQKTHVLGRMGRKSVVPKNVRFHFEKTSDMLLALKKRLHEGHVFPVGHADPTTNA